METLTICPNCKAELKSGIFSSNSLVSEEKTKAINALTDNNAIAHCEKCAPSLLQKAQLIRNNKITPLENEFKRTLPYIPIITLQQPKNWEYDVLRIVTAQSVTGTGVISEISSSWADLLGGQSDKLSNKLKGGENICKNKLRAEAAFMGANAIIGTDIDYAEVGGDKGMLMVCMAGTAIRLTNCEVLEHDCSEALISLQKVVPELTTLRGFDSVLNNLVIYQ
jgi:uncharacterized protein YbjQ (UPF0145 family)